MSFSPPSFSNVLTDLAFISRIFPSRSVAVMAPENSWTQAWRVMSVSFEGNSEIDMVSPLVEFGFLERLGDAVLFHEGLNFLDRSRDPGRQDLTSGLRDQDRVLDAATQVLFREDHQRLVGEYHPWLENHGTASHVVHSQADVVPEPAAHFLEVILGEVEALLREDLLHLGSDLLGGETRPVDGGVGA